MKTPKTMTIVLTASQERTIPVPGMFMHIRSCSVASFEAAFGEDALQTFYPGATYPSAERFEKVRVRDSLGGGCTLILVFSENPLRDVAYDEVILSNINTGIAGLQTELEAIHDEQQGISTAADYDVAAVGTDAVEVIAANASRRGCVVMARWDNTGIIYLGYTNAVGSGKYQSCHAASEGFSWNDYRGPIWAEASAAAQEVGWGEW